MTPPPGPSLQFKNSFGKSNNFPNQFIVTTSSSVQAGEEIQENPMQPIPALSISPTIEGYELPAG